MSGGTDLDLHFGYVNMQFHTFETSSEQDSTWRVHIRSQKLMLGMFTLPSVRFKSNGSMSSGGQNVNVDFSL